MLRTLFRSLFLLMLVTVAQHALAQGMGSISGTVTDPSGASIPTAVIVARQLGTGTLTTAKANEVGSYVFPSLLPADYSISVSAPGFESYSVQHITLQANQSLSINAKLQIGATTQTVSVDADAVEVDTTTPTLSQVVDTARVNDLPLNGRNAAQLTTLVAGVITAPNEGTDQGVTKTFPSAVEITANGSLAGQTVYLLDGADNLDSYTDANLPFPFPDALQEFSFQTSNYTAEYGESPGGIVNVVTQSGTSKFHGDAFEYVRNGDLNARNYFASTVDPLKRNQFGGTIGGPVRIPHVSSGKNTFFFFGYQRTDESDEEGGVSSFVPTQANLNGDFSAMLSATNPDNPLHKAVQIDNPTTGQPYYENQIPTTTFDPAAVALTKDLPAATGNGQIVYQTPLVQEYNEFLGRVDQNLGANDRAFVHYYSNDFTQDGVLNPSNLVTYADQDSIHVQNALISESHTFTSNLLNQFTLGYEREISHRGPLAGAPDAGSFGVNIYQPTPPMIQEISTSGFFSIGDEALGTFQRNNYTFSDNLHWVKGRHNLAFGGSIELAKMDVNSQTDAAGLFYFDASETNYALASFLLGSMYEFEQGSGEISNDRDQFYSLYGEDAWQVAHRLTLTYGLRWEPFLPWQEIGHRLMQFNPAAYAAGRVSTVYTNAPAGLLFPGDSGMPEQGVRNSYYGFMPRLGFAWDVRGDGKTSVRGGAGMFYETRQTAILNQKSSQVTPFSISVTLTPPQGTFSNPYAGTTNPFPAPSPTPSNTAFPSPVEVYEYDPSGNFQVPVTYEWNLTTEQQLTQSLLARIAYVGTHSTHLFAALDMNPSVYIPGSTLTTDQRRVYPGYSDITQTSMVGNDSYNSMQATLQQHVRNGLSVMANYTWSHSMTDLPLQNEIADQDVDQSYVIPVYQPNFKRLDIGPPDYDSTNVFSGSYVWTLPNPSPAVPSSVLRYVLRDWQTSGLFQAQSGTPITIVAGADISKTDLMQDRAVYSGSGAYGSGACLANTACKNYLNPNAFSLPATGTFGNVEKGSFRGPGYFDWDAALIRNFAVNENAHFAFRAEYFNLLNHTNFENPVTSLSAADFGGIKSANDPRIAQLSMKFIF